mgnify:CR=1 FL=1
MWTWVSSLLGNMLMYDIVLKSSLWLQLFIQIALLVLCVKLFKNTRLAAYKILTISFGISLFLSIAWDLVGALQILQIMSSEMNQSLMIVTSSMQVGAGLLMVSAFYGLWRSSIKG